ncbi:MAG: alpha-ketoacid dehydrogenase subunit beta [Thermodesulfobacteriota bacterium]
MPWTKIYGDKSAFEKAAAESKTPLRGLCYSEALREAQAQLLSSDERVFIMGEGIDDPGGVFGSTTDLHKEFGDERVFDTPLAENGLTGIAMGAALAGLRPILVHMRIDFMPLTMDQIINHAAKWHYMFGGKVHVPLIIRSIVGRGWGSAAQHSQNLHALFAHVPGLRVVMPTTPYDAKGMLMAASADGNPVIFIEHRWLYGHMGHVPEEPYTVPIGKAIVRRAGSDVTIAAISHMAAEATKAAETLAEEGIEAELIDMRSMRPLDTDTVIESVKKTGRLIIADTGWKSCGIGAEITTRVVEEAFGALKAPVVRINTAEVPTPASSVLEDAYYPGASDVVTAAKKLVKA